jgi:hypothetical protein
LKIEQSLIEEYHTLLLELITAKPLNSQQRSVWTIPDFIVMFLENSIKRFKEDPDSVKPKLSSWSSFKNHIYMIIDHRLQNAAEISGMVNSSHMTFAEHLLVYFVETCRSREAAEQKVLWFLACLLYFSERQWDRAISYATMLGCLKDPQHDLH